MKVKNCRPSDPTRRNDELTVIARMGYEENLIPYPVLLWELNYV